MPQDDLLSTLLEWCAENNIRIDDRIHIKIYGDEIEQQGVFAKDEFIPAKTTLVKIPKGAVLSVKTSSIAHLVPQYHFGVGAQLSLSLALYVEILKQTQSRFYGYLQSLPNGIVDLPVFWSLNEHCERAITQTPDHGDASAALAWLSGTDAGELLTRKTENGSTLLDEVISFYHAEALPAIRNLTRGHEAASPPTATPDFLGFCRAFSLVSSRAFLIDAFHGLAMVPVADAFNHVIEHSIHLESDYDVCPECGSLDECVHDQGTTLTEEENPCRGGSEKTFVYNDDRHLEMLSNLAIPPRSEIFNTYGDHLSNAQLLNQYGFILDVNHNDRLKWTVQQVLETLSLQDIDVDLDSDSNPEAGASGNINADLHAVSSVLSDASSRSPSRLTFFDNERRITDGYFYCLNDEGNLSRELWALLFILSLRDHRKIQSLSGIQSPTAVASSVWELQIWAENNGDSEDSDEDIITDMDEEEPQATSQGASRNPIPESLLDPLVQSILLQMSGWVMDLCDARKRCIGIPDAWKMDLSDVMENLPKDYTRTRTAITLVMAERSILQCCEMAWKSVHSAISQHQVRGL